ncbi:SpoIIE family protein phosphatase [Kitasatospora sp. GAS204B]|uniref:SpoIIE family protein phosphatase n=1 Tax=unclassified Kitasatospora TaxID=2633591 RepID=UPI00247680AC|nr:SpoIIE family protein phosphatase [Kitasatospora sp. GAS204B]MDH6122664.1 GAF domain-containing protein [Kitasatospora sp. GAS204B]
MHAETSGQNADSAHGEPAVAGEAALVRAAFDSAPVGLAIVDPELRWVRANLAFLALTGCSAAELLGHPVADTSLRELGPALRQALAGAQSAELSLGPGVTLRCRRLESDHAAAGVLVTVAADEQVRARLTLLKTAADRIGSTLDADTTCIELARFAVDTGIAEFAAVDLLPGSHSGTVTGRIRLHRAALAATPALTPRLAGLAQPGESVRYGDDSVAAQCLTTGQPVLGEAPAELAAPGGAEQSLAVPLIARGRTVGILWLARPGAAAPEFGGEGLVLIEDLCGHAALSIDNALRYTSSQGVALDLQRALLADPATPHPNLQLATRYLPSGSSSVVGGDWYEAVRLPFGRTLLVIGDVMGHGVEAAVDMSTYRSMLRYTASMDLPPHRILRQLDALISENETARPATCLLALADPNRRRWTFASAGHLPPALITPGLPTELVELPTGPPLGSGLADYAQVTRPLLPAQVLLLYTDGLVERRHEDIDVSLARLADLPLQAGADLEDLLDTVLHQLAATPAQDDTALLAARARPPQEPGRG